MNQSREAKDLTMDFIIESCLILMVLLLQKNVPLLVLIVQLTKNNSSRDKKKPFSKSDSCYLIWLRFVITVHYVIKIQNVLTLLFYPVLKLYFTVNQHIL